MALTEITSTLIRNFNLTLYNGVAVVRNYRRVIGLMSPWYKEMPTKYHEILATPNFSGNVGSEEIFWTTKVFDSEPKKLTELDGGERERYRKILTDAMQAWADVLTKADAETRDMLYAAITYPSESSVFCGNGRIVITDWGMTETGTGKATTLPFAIDDPIGNKPEYPVKPEGNPEKKTEDEPEQSKDIAGDTESDRGNDAPLLDPEPPVIVNKLDPEPPGPEKPKDDGKKKQKQPWWSKWWIWLILALLLIGIILFFILRVGHEDKETLIEENDPTELTMDDFELQDSLNMVAKNRLLILVTNRDKTLAEFARDFRDVYTDSKKYVLSNPDTIFNRVTLSFPEGEREKLQDKLPAEFPSYDLTVIPVSLMGSEYSPSDPDFADQQKRWYFDMIEVYDAWDVTQGSPDIVVAIIDDGFDLNHAEFQGRIVDPYNAVSHNANVVPSKRGHGVHVAGCAVAGIDNAKGVSGIAPKCKLMPIQVANSQGLMTNGAVMDAIAWAYDHGANVVNLSLGMEFGEWMQFAPLYIQRNIKDNMFLQEEKVWNHIFDTLADKGICVTLAAGNENILIGMDPMDRNTRTIIVSAVDPDGRKCDFSNFGELSTVSAPGRAIWNSIPNNDFGFKQGTSMAAPIVAGGAALLLSKDPTLSPEEIKKILVETGMKSPSPDIGPIINLGRALHADLDNLTPGTDCEEVNRRYHELLQQIDQLKRQYPGCIQEPDTLSLPINFTVTDLSGKWKSTSVLTNSDNQAVTLYFTFDGSNNGLLEIVEPSGAVASAPLNVSISNDVLYIDQTCSATGTTPLDYNPYKFTIKPDRNRKADGFGKNKKDILNQFDFTLVRI